MSTTALTLQIGGDISKLRAEMLKANGLMNGFKNTLSHVGAAMGLTFGATGVFMGLKAGIKIMGDFEKEMSTVKAITNATASEFKLLEADAKRLGGATKFTASQVAQLQVAYGRLGFNTQEILDATEATLSLAAATGEDLAKSADVAGSTVRGFGLDAKETIRVVDVMASSFNKSALSLENFTESMKFVAPIAKAAGATVEETTALLATLADSGIRGSMAGTSLRRIFADLTKDGRPLQARLEELGKKGLTLSDSFDEVGRVAQTALLVLSENTNKTKELTNEFDNAAGSAKKMADIIEDNLWGDVTQLTSAIEGLVLQFKEGTGTMREFVRALTEAVRWMSKDEVVAFLKGTAEQALFLNWLKLAQAMSETNDEGERMNEWLKKLHEDSMLAAFGPDVKSSDAWNPFTGDANMNAQAKAIEDAAKAIAKYRGQYEELLKTIGFKTPKVKRGGGDVGDEFYHRDINMDPNSSMGLDLDNPVPGIVKEIEFNEQLATSLEKLNELREQQLNKMQATAEMAVTMGEAIGDAFNGMLSGTMNFAQGLTKVTEEIITLYLRQSIAAMIAAAIKDPSTPFPIAKVAIAAAGIGAVKAMFNQIGGAFGSSGSTGGPPGRLPSEMKHSIGGRIRGYDLAIVSEKEGYRRGRVG